MDEGKGLIHNDGADRTDWAAIAAGQTFLVIYLRQSPLIIKNRTGRAGFFAGAAAFTVRLIDMNLLA